MSAVSIPAAIAVAETKSAEIATGRRSACSEHQVQQQHCNQHGGEHPPGILPAVGYDLRAPGPKQQALAWRLLLTSRYFSDEFTEVKLVLRLVPMPLTAARITMLRPTAIRQYSIAVAPD